jgi:hypothetical protein
MIRKPVVSSKSSASFGGGVLFAMLALFIGAVWFWWAPGVGAPDYPDDWSAPRLFTGSKGGCPDLTGRYDDVDDVVPRLLQGGPAWVQGGHPWFEHLVEVTQASDGSSLEMRFALNERGLPRHRAHVLAHNQGWPHGDTLLLKRDVDFHCRGRWLRPTRNSSVFVSRNRAGDVIVGETRQVDSGLHYANLEIGPAKIDKTTWRRWTSRPASADAQLQALYSFEVHRFPWLNRGGSEVVVHVANYMGEDVCTRVWNVNAQGADSTGANASVLAGAGSDATACPPPWLHLPHLGNINFGLTTPDVSYRIAWRPQSMPDAAPSTMEVPRPEALPLMPDEEEERRRRAHAGLTPEQRAQARANEQQRAQLREQERAEQEKQRREQALAAEPRFASEASVRERIQSLLYVGVDVTKVVIADRRVHIHGDAASNEKISQLLRAIMTTDENALPDLVSVRQQDGRIYFEIMIRPCTLTEL